MPLNTEVDYNNVVIKGTVELGVKGERGLQGFKGDQGPPVPVAHVLGDDPDLAVSQKLLTDAIADMEQSNEAAVMEATHQAGLAGDSAGIAASRAGESAQSAQAASGSALAAGQYASTATDQAGIAAIKAGEASSSAEDAADSEAAAKEAADRAEAASDAAFVNADVYPDVASGLAAVAVGEQFQVLSADGLEYRRYRKDSGTVATEVGGGFPSTEAVQQIGSDVGSLSRVLGSDTVETIAFAVVSKDGIPLLHLKNSGALHLFNEEVSVQERLAGSGVTTAPDESALRVVSHDGDHDFLHIQDNGDVFILGGCGSLQSQLRELRASAYINALASTQSEGARVVLANAVLGAKARPLFSMADIALYSGIQGEIQRIAAIMKVSDGRIICFWGGGVAGYDGDSFGVKLYKSFINYDKFGNITVEGKTLFRSPPTDDQVSKHPMLGRTSDGRVILIWDEGIVHIGGYKQYVAYSSDEGETFTPPVMLFDNDWVAGSTGKIVTLENGRIVLPMYTGSDFFLMYSDDDGSTWTQSNILSGGEFLRLEPSADVNADGEIIIALRSQAGALYRYFAKSVDGGQTLIDLGQNLTLPSNDCASSIAFDPENGLTLHGVPSSPSSRTGYEVKISADGGYTFIASYKPFDYHDYIGYSQIIPLGSNRYALVAEGFNQMSSVINRNENIKIVIFNLEEVLLNVSNH